MSEWDEAQERMDEVDELQGDRLDDDFDGIDELVDPDEVDELPDEVRAGLEAVASAEAETHAALERALAETTRALEEQREATRVAVARYREALLAADANLEAARAAPQRRRTLRDR